MGGPMFEHIPENRPSAAAAARLLQLHCAEACRSGHLTSARRSNTRLFGKYKANRKRRLRKLVIWIQRIGEKLARWRLAFSDYPWEGGSKITADDRAAAHSEARRRRPIFSAVLARRPLG
jgi:hypothetical protein